MAKKGLKRRIHFYSTEVWEVGGKGKDQLVAPGKLLDHLDAVVSKADWQRELEEGSRSQGILCHRLRDKSLQGQFWLDKHDDFPLVGDGQSSAPLETDGHPLRYPSHFVWWDLSKFPEISGAPKNPAGLLVMERSQQGPRSTALEVFLNEKASGRFRVKIDPLVSAEALERLQGSALIKKVRVRTEDPDAVRALEQDGKLAGMYVLGGLKGIEEFEWSVKASGAHRLHLLERFIPLLKRSQEEALPINVWITFEDDLELPLEDAAVQHVSKTIPRSAPNARCVDSAAMLAEIRNAFEAKRKGLGVFFGRHLI